MEFPLEGKIALVAGATRGAGRGTAVALGEAGALVYCTGRTTKSHASDYRRPETIEETAAMVSAAGGTGVAVAVDHFNAAEVAALDVHVNVTGLPGSSPAELAVHPVSAPGVRTACPVQPKVAK